MVSFTRPLTFGRRVAASLATGVGVALVAHVATVFVYYVVNGATPENLGPINAYFLPSSLVLFALASLGASLGAYRHKIIAGLVGLLAGIIAFFAGTVWGYLMAGGTMTDAPAFAAAALIGPGLFFIVTAAAVMAVVGRRLWKLWLRLTAGVSRPIALVRRPSSRLADGELTHLERTPVDSALADEQWQDYVEALEANGFEIVDVAAADELPDSVFIEDTVIVFGGTAVIASPGAESRRDETDAVAESVRALGLAVREIVLPGTLDGGDVLKVGDTVYVGRGGRTNSEGVAQLRSIVGPLGYDVVAVPVKKVLHLKSAVTALPDGTIIGQSKVVDTPGLFPRFLALPEPGASVVVLSEDTVLMAASVPKSAALIADLGYRVVTVDISEFEKLEGCVTCLSVRIR